MKKINKFTCIALCMWGGSFTIGLNPEYSQKVLSGAVEIEQLVPDVFTQVADLHNFYTSWRPAFDQWESDHDSADMSVAEYMQGLADAGLGSPYYMMSNAQMACESMYDEHGDVLQTAFPNVKFVTRTLNYRSLSSWDKFGDLDGDGVVSASDASDLLLAAAAAGSGADSGLSTTAQRLADVNNDGVFNAEDAAILLMYAAEQGSGGSMTLKEFVSQK